MNNSELNTDGMTEAQISYVERLEKRIEKGLAVCASKDKEIERLQKYEDYWIQLHGEA
tara:strand:- start:22 stop:195 length:174 start_codon:yes stop_codon:yes gene_type:complete